MPLSWAGFASRIARQPCSLQNQAYVAARRQVAELRAATDHFFIGELSALWCDFYGLVTWPPSPSPLGVSCAQVALIVGLADGMCR